MEIVTLPHGGHVELVINGRVDAMWAEHLNGVIESAVRAGGHRIVLNFAGVEYISSMGLRILLVQYKLLKSVGGNLAISQPSEFCRNILSVVGLSQMIVEDDAGADAATPLTVTAKRYGAVDYEVYPQAVQRTLSWKLIGNPEILSTTGFHEDDCRTLSFPGGVFGIGLGAFGQGYADCMDRFGEFLAAGGCAISLPTNDPHALPDYVIEEGQLVPQVETLYAITGEGDFSTMLRFDAAPDGPGKVMLSELIDNVLDISGADSVGMVVLAETAGIVGAALRRSPAGKPMPHTLPDVREWLSFTTERNTEKSLCLIAGVVSRTVDEAAQPFLRPVRSGSAIAGHLHAAVFPYRPVQRGELPFATTIADLLAASSPNSVLHLMADSRRFEGVGETDLIRGACWFGPLPATREQA